MKKAKKVLALMLVGLLVLSVLGACGKKQGEEQKGNKEGSETDTTNASKTDDEAAGDKTLGSDTGGQDTSETDDWTWPLPEKKELSITTI